MIENGMKSADMELVELNFQGKKKELKLSFSHSCPICGETGIDNSIPMHARYACGYSSGHPSGDTPCSRKAQWKKYLN